ncbi:MAG: hypothetical protein ETSY2_43920, partial [Candidatus Entotheonella gemina]
MRLIRSRLTLMLVIGMGLLLVGAGALISSVLKSSLQQEFDQGLLGKASLLMALIEDEGDVIEFDYSDDLMPEFSRSDQPAYFQLWLHSGTRIEKSPSLGSHDLPRSPGLAPAPTFRNITLPNGRHGRLVQIAFIPQVEKPDDPDEKEDEEEDKGELEANAGKQREEDIEIVALDPRQFPNRAATLIVARDRTQLDGLIRALNLFLAGLTISLLIIMAVLVRLALRAGLRPLDDMRQQASRLDVDSLTTGIHLHTETAELTPVVNQINALLHRLDAAFRRERQFSSNVAHELRTPLAELRVLTEVGGRWPEDRDAVEQYFSDAHGICEQMERVVISLLTLTRCERGVQPVQMTPIRLRQIVETSWQHIKQTATEKSQRFECDIHPSRTITSDYDMLLMVLINLLSNAVFHSAPSSVIRCVATQHGGETYLTMGAFVDSY